jgi:hypothetical protein
MTEETAPQPQGPKMGPIILNLEVNEEIKPISFLVEVLKGAEYVQTYPYPRASGLLGANQKTMPKLGLLVVYKADMDENNPPEPRCIVLMEAGEWVMSANILGSFRSILDGRIYAISEIPVSEEQHARWVEMRAEREAVAVRQKAEEARQRAEAEAEVPNTDSGQARKQTSQDVVDFLSEMKARRRKPTNE